MCSLERQCIGNSFFTNRIFVSVVGIAFTIAVPTLVSIVLPLFLAVVIPAYDRVAAVVQNPAVTDRCKGKNRRIVACTIFNIRGAIKIITCCLRMIVIQLCSIRNGNLSIILNTAAIRCFTTIIHDNSACANINFATVSDCRNSIVNQFYSCIVCKIHLCSIRITHINGKSANIIVIQDFFLRVIASTGNGQCRTILHIDIATPQKDASGTIILHRQCRAILHCQNVGTILTSHTHIVMTNLCLRVVQCQSATYKTLIFTIGDCQRRIFNIDFAVDNTVCNTIIFGIIDYDLRTILNIYNRILNIGFLFICTMYCCPTSI